MATLYHYSNTKFDNFDLEKCDGIWLTSISPAETEMLEEIGASGMSFVAKVDVCLDDLERMINANNYDVEDQLLESGCDYIENIYDGFQDYALSSDEAITSISWSEL